MHSNVIFLLQFSVTEGNWGNASPSSLSYFDCSFLNDFQVLISYMKSTLNLIDDTDWLEIPRILIFMRASPNLISKSKVYFYFNLSDNKLVGDTWIFDFFS